MRLFVCSFVLRESLFVVVPCATAGPAPALCQHARRTRSRVGALWARRASDVLTRRGTLGTHTWARRASAVRLVTGALGHLVKTHSTHVRTHACTSAHPAPAHACWCAHTLTQHTLTHAHAHVWHRRPRTRRHTHADAHTHTRIHTHTRARTRTCTYWRTHTVRGCSDPAVVSGAI